jgi:hypothetical protein
MTTGTPARRSRRSSVRAHGSSSPLRPRVAIRNVVRPRAARGGAAQPARSALRSPRTPQSANAISSRNATP